MLIRVDPLDRFGRRRTKEATRTTIRAAQLQHILLDGCIWLIDCACSVCVVTWLRWCCFGGFAWSRPIVVRPKARHIFTEHDEALYKLSRTHTHTARTLCEYVFGLLAARLLGVVLLLLLLLRGSNKRLLWGLCVCVCVGVVSPIAHQSRGCCCCCCG